MTHHIENRERKRRSLERRLTNARIGAFKPIADFDWNWPKRIDRALIEELFSLAFVHDATNVVLVRPNGIGKTMLVKNLLHHAVLHGFTARFTMASDMLHEFAAQDSDASLARRLRRFTQPQLLAIDELGYLIHVLAASRAQELATELQLAPNGALTYLVLEGIHGKADGAFDGRNDNRVSVREIVEYATREMPNLAGRLSQAPISQKPVGYSRGADFALAEL